MGRFSSTQSELKLYYALLRQYVKSRSLEEGKQIHAIVTDRGYDQFAFYGNLLIDLYGSCGFMEQAEAAFLKTHNPTDITYSTMITAYAENGYLQRAEKLFFPIKDKGPKSCRDMLKAYFLHGMVEKARALFHLISTRDAQHWNMMVEGNARNGRMEEALEFFGRMPYKESSTCRSVIMGFVNLGDLRSARSVFDHASHKRVVHWNDMIAAYARNGHLGKSLEVFRLMDLEGVGADQASFVGLLDACANAAALRDGGVVVEESLAVAPRGVFSGSVVVLTSAVNMFAKCGGLELAERLFRRISDDVKDVVLWTAMATAYAQNGDGAGALLLFRRMNQDGGVRANDISFITFLSACGLAGDLQTAVDCVRWMKIDYGVIPIADHYICLVDQLARCGDLEGAEDLLTNMPFEPEPVAWLTLLSACKNLQDLRLGLRAAQRVLELDPQNSAPYSLMAGLKNGLN